MAKRKLSRTDTRTSGGAGRRKSSRNSDKKSSTRPTNSERSERPKSKFSEKPFDRKGPSSKFGREENDRPKRSYTRGDAPSGERKSERPFERKKPFGTGERRSSRPDGFRANADSKPRRGFPEGFKREEGGSEDRPKRPFRPGDSPTRPNSFNRDSGRGFDKKRSFGDRPDRDERPKRPFRSDDSFKKDSDRPYKKPFSNDADKPFARKRPFDRDLPAGERPRRSSISDDELPAHNFSKSEDKPFERRKPFADREVNSESAGKEKRPRKSFTENKKFSSKGYTAKRADEDDGKPQKMRLNRYLANSGISSRREADEFIKMGLVTVNGTTITEMGYQVQPGDIVKYEGKMMRAEKPIYILMNKPKGYLTTTRDPDDRMTVMEIIGSAVKERIYPVGRLDRNTTGLLLLTNDGALTEQLSHPSYNVKKIYKVELDRPLAKTDFEKIGQGVYLEEGRAMVDDIAIVSDDGKTVGLEIHIGWNRVVRRIFESLEYTVVKLDRTIYAGLDKKELARGQWRFLREEEVIRLKHLKKGT